MILENIRSAHNVGSVFRTADGAGVSKIFLVGYTPTPTDRFGRTQPEIAKTSLGASEEIPWEHTTSITEVIDGLHKSGVQITAVEQAKESISLAQFVAPENIAYILGNEVDGVSSEALSAVDLVVEIPMLGTKESLNVSVTAGIVLYHDVVYKK